MSNVAEEFKNPERDFHRSIILSVIVVSSLYLSVAVATIGTQAYKAGGSVAPFAAILSNALGLYGGVSTGVLAVFIIFGTVNAYTTGIFRVICSVAKEGGSSASDRSNPHQNWRSSPFARIIVRLVIDHSGRIVFFEH